MEKEEVMDMSYMYKDAFSVRDKVGTFPNIEVEIDVTDKSQFIKLNHVKEAMAILDREMKKVILLTHCKRRFFSIFKSSHVAQ